MAIPKKEVIVKSNNLIEASYRLNLIEQRIILMAIVYGREHDLCYTTDPIRIEASKFTEMFSMEENNVYEQLKDGMKTLIHRLVKFKRIDEVTNKEEIGSTHWISAGSYIDEAGTIKIIFAQEIVPLITRLEKEFTSYNLEKVGKMNSIYAVRLYEILIQHLHLKNRIINLKWLREILELENKYKSIKDLKSRVIDNSVEQINEHSDIYVKYTQRKSGREVTDFIFSMEPKEEFKITKKPKLTKSYIEKHALPGETYAQALDRLKSKG